MKAIPRLRDTFAPRRLAVLAGYSSGEFWRSKLWLFGLLYVIALTAIGGMFAFWGTNVLMPLAAVVAILVLLVIWALPDTDNPPLVWIRRLLFAYVISFAFWPEYLAFDFPGLPWITALRIFGVPLTIIFLISLSVSKSFRQDLLDKLSAAPLVHRFLIMFMIIAAISLGFSNQPGHSLNRLVVAGMYWFVIFYAALWVFSKPGSITVFAYIVWFFALFTCLVGLQEWRIQGLPWAGHIPSFIAVDDPVIQTILSPKSRASTGIYRLQSKFTTPLGFAEFLAFCTPFLLYFAIYGKNAAIKIAAYATLPLVFLSIVRTDSRLGAVGFFISFLLFLVAWSITRWKQNKESIFGPAFTISYPIIAFGFFIATFFVGRLRNMVWGTKAASYSSLAREAQVDMGLPMIWSRPWGHGMGLSGETLGYRNLAGTLTIDSYYLALGLEFGVLGFLIYAAVFIAPLIYGLKYLLQLEKQEHFLIIPLMTVISIFIVVKSVFAQQENHTFVFLCLGALCALFWRIKTETGQVGQ